MDRGKMFIVTTALIFAAVASSRAATNPVTQRLNDADGVLAGQSRLAPETGSHSLFNLPASQEFRLAQFSVVATIDGGDDDDHPHSRSKHCPDKDDHPQKFTYDGDQKDKDKDKDKDHDHDHCGKGDDDKNP